MFDKFAVVIPARIGSTRLPKKLIKLIGENTVIEHVILSLQSADIKNLYVATDSDDIAYFASKLGVNIVKTDTDCKSGSDRVFQAIKKIEEGNRFDYVINVQGDMPFLDASIVKNISNKLITSDFDIVTSYVKIGQSEAKLPENVKIVKDIKDKALYFSRSMIPYGAKEFLYHVGIYGFRMAALERFVKLDHGEYEECEKLEQLRALENGMTIGLVESQQIPISIDTEEDYQKAVLYFRNSQ